MIKLENEWISISEEEYNKAYNKACPKTDNELLDKLNQSDFNMEFRKDPVYKESGLLYGLLENPEIIGYNYYKKGEPKWYIIGSKEHVEKIMTLINKMVLNEIRKQKISI